MSRELRRHPLQKKGAARRDAAKGVAFKAPARTQPQQARAAAERRAAMPRWQRLIPRPQFLVDIVSELKKVTWPTLSETRYLSTVVIIVAVVIGVLLGGIDLLFGEIMRELLF